MTSKLTREIKLSLLLVVITLLIISVPTFDKLNTAYGRYLNYDAYRPDVLANFAYSMTGK